MPVKLPNRLNSEVLKRLAQPGEPFMLILATNVGDVSPYELCDENGRSYVFRWDVKEGCHVLRVPVSVWTQNRRALALALFDTRSRNGPNLVPVPEFPTQQGSSVAERGTHNSEVGGAIPSPATIMKPVEAASVLSPYDLGAIKQAMLDASLIKPVEAKVETLEDAVSEDKPVVESEISEEPTEVGDAAHPLEELLNDGEEFLHVVIARTVATKPARVADLVESLGASKEDVVAAIAYEGSGLVNASGWVKLKTEA